MNSSHLLIAVSNITHGSISASVSDEQRLRNRKFFLHEHAVTAEQTILVRLTYDSEDFRRYYTVSAEQAGDGIVTQSTLTADALFTKTKNVVLLLPVADCIAAVLYDPTTQVLGLSHFGRHNLVQNGGESTVEYMCTEFGCNPANIQIFLGPAAGRKNYPLYDFSNRSLHEVATSQLVSAGIKIENITVDERDTTTDDSLFSHSQFLKTRQESDGRQAVICMMRG